MRSPEGERRHHGEACRNPDRAFIQQIPKLTSPPCENTRLSSLLGLETIVSNLSSGLRMVGSVGDKGALLKNGTSHGKLPTFGACWKTTSTLS